MIKRILIVISALTICASAWAADVAVDDSGYCASPSPGYMAPTYDQSTLELGWDNGSRRWSVAWYTGAGSWVGNDFDISTLKTEYVKILKFKMYTRDNWPNTQWDGFGFGFYGFSGGVPGSMLWPTSGGSGYIFVPSGASGHVWVECDVDWVCPSVKFVAAQHQYYNWPNCDPWGVDTNETFLNHSWQYYGGSWSPLSSASTEIDPYFNLMVRVWVEDGQTFPGIAPSSIGRVKALYY
ncbi:MAG: hypothetical protein PVH29_05755 [Candidatus Zixiibacteriota bacterium]